MKIKGTEDPFEREVSVQKLYSHVPPKITVSLTEEEEEDEEEETADDTSDPIESESEDTTSDDNVATSLGKE